MSYHLTYLQAVVTGLVQGVTELFPVSSLGHNVLLPALIGGSWAKTLNVSATGSPYLAFIVGLHVATAIAMIAFFWRDWLRIVRGFFSSIGERRIATPDQRLAWMIILGTIPVGIVGLVLQKEFIKVLAKPELAAMFLAINGVILLVERADAAGKEEPGGGGRAALTGRGGGLGLPLTGQRAARATAGLGPALATGLAGRALAGADGRQAGRRRGTSSSRGSSSGRGTGSPVRADDRQQRGGAEDGRGGQGGETGDGQRRRAAVRAGRAGAGPVRAGKTGGRTGAKSSTGETSTGRIRGAGSRGSRRPSGGAGYGRQPGYGQQQLGRPAAGPGADAWPASGHARRTATRATRTRPAGPARPARAAAARPGGTAARRRAAGDTGTRPAAATGGGGRATPRRDPAVAADGRLSTIDALASGHHRRRPDPGAAARHQP